VDAVSAALITKSLDGLALRLKVTATNIANANSPAYRPSQVTFEQSLKAAANRGLDAVAAVTPEIKAEPRGAFGDEPRTDLELDTAAATAGRYSALVELLAREIDITRTAIKGGQQ
jgi:flagellar basal-body rod protein FlgB